MISSLLRQLRIAAAAMAAVAPFAPALALNVQPLALDMVSIGSRAHSTIEIVNDGATPMPVEVTIHKLDISVEGKTSETEAGNDFLVFPPQSVVPAGATQTFRIQWVGEPNIQKSQTYMFSVNQLPVRKKVEETGVQVVFNFGVIVSVAPPGAQSAMKLVSAEPATEGGKHGAVITVENPSGMYAYFTDAGVALESGSWRKNYAAGELKDVLGYAVLLPGKKRRFFVPGEVPAGVGKITATLNYTPKTAK